MIMANRQNDPHRHRPECGGTAKEPHDMTLSRIIDTDPCERSRMVRAALDCFAPLAITIRPKPGIFDIHAKHSRSR